MALVEAILDRLASIEACLVAIEVRLSLINPEARLSEIEARVAKCFHWRQV